ncbi:hypothetical protein QYE76_000116 [Lolium multiflorum]|uniref:NADP-dependent oxidoreductase domain-containing protein n=1 Tax=Lolium multiflorum TaxID=4521 RepID=A0AAD8VDN5_LOLMU|nr:hypothetical protein QYE76_000116 [Lolium multiflorum]
MTFLSLTPTSPRKRPARPGPRAMAATALALSSGHQMPAVGLGVWRMDSPAIRGLIHSALRAGYRHFDCAAKYQNEAEVGDALAEAFETGLVKREDIFITTKLWNSDHGHVLEACKDSLKKLRLDYLDLYLIHFPVATKHTGVGTTASVLGDDGVLDIDTTISLETTWHAMEDLVSKGLVRSIGISNCGIFLTRDILAYAKIKPAVNQIETHPYFQRESLVKFCQKHGHTHPWAGPLPTPSCLAPSRASTIQSSSLWPRNMARRRRSSSSGGPSRGTRW